MKSKTFTTETAALHQLEISMTRYKINKRVISLAKGEDESRITPVDADAIAFLCREHDYDSHI